MLEAIPDQNDSEKEAIRYAAEAKAGADKGDWDEARAAMAKAIDLSANNATYHALMAWYTFQCSLQPAFERQRLAEHHLSVALEMEPENAQAHYYQGLIWAGGGNTTRARIALATALNLKPNFQAAAQALDKLGKVSEPKERETTSTSATFARAKSRKATLILPLAAALLLVGGGGAAVLYYSGQPAGAADLAKKLGTKLPLVSTSRAGSAGQDLHIDVGPAWGKLSREDQATEMHNIGKGAQGMGIENVFVYSEGQPVAQSHGESVCMGDCVVSPVAKPAEAGQPVRLAPAAAAKGEAAQAAAHLKVNKR
jgi:tetratricopeptide (TPR) repeat protein